MNERPMTWQQFWLPIVILAAIAAVTILCLYSQRVDAEGRKALREAQQDTQRIQEQAQRARRGW